MSFNLNDTVYFVSEISERKTCDACSGCGQVELSNGARYSCPACLGDGETVVTTRVIKSGTVAAINTVSMSSMFDKVKDMSDCPSNTVMPSSSFRNQLCNTYYIHDPASCLGYSNIGLTFHDYTLTNFMLVKECELFKTEDLAQSALNYKNNLHELLIF